MFACVYVLTRSHRRPSTSRRLTRRASASARISATVLVDEKRNECVRVINGFHSSLTRRQQPCVRRALCARLSEHTHPHAHNTRTHAPARLAATAAILASMSASLGSSVGCARGDVSEVAVAPVHTCSQCASEYNVAWTAHTHTTHVPVSAPSVCRLAARAARRSSTAHNLLRVATPTHAPAARRRASSSASSLSAALCAQADQQTRLPH
jgi:hypothetical protein